jgi:hypothetical protein
MKNVIINNTKFFELKPDTFYYCNKKYIQERFLSEDKKVLITRDDGFHYVRFLIGMEDGKAEDVTSELLNRNINSYPCYYLDEVKSFEYVAKHEIKVHVSHYEK